MKRFTAMAFTLSIMIVILLCSSDRLHTDNFSIQHRAGTTQAFSVLLLDQQIAEYMEAVKNDPDKPKGEIFEEKVFQSVWEECFQNGEYLPLLAEVRKTPPEELVYLEKITKDKQSLRKVKDTVQEALIQSAHYLPSQATTTVCIMPTTSRNNSALTIGSGKILLFYNPYLFRSDHELAGTVAHEYHHSVWTSKHFDPYQPFTLLDALLFEGKAMHFQETVYPGSSHIPNYDDRYGEVREELMNRLGSVDINLRNEMMFGNERIPYAFGYSEGYRVVRQYLQENPQVKIEQWTSMEPEEFLKKMD